MFRQRLRLILLKIGVFVTVGGPLAAIEGASSGHDELTRYALAAALIAGAVFVLLLKPARDRG
jgi:hypothetical protein